MASEKLARILQARSPFTAEQIAAMSEADGWDWVYSNAAPRKEKLMQVCFTGFSTAEKAGLIAIAKEHRLAVATTVTKELAFLCTGENAGPAKLAKAMAQGVTLLTRSQLEHLLATGEIVA